MYLHRVTELNCSIWLINVIVKSTTTLGQSGPGSNSKEGVLHIPLISKTGGLTIRCSLVSYLIHSLVEVLPFGRDAVSDFNFSRLSGCVMSLDSYQKIGPLRGVIFGKQAFSDNYEGKIPWCWGQRAALPEWVQNPVTLWRSFSD